MRHSVSAHLGAQVSAPSRRLVREDVVSAVSFFDRCLAARASSARGVVCSQRAAFSSRYYMTVPKRRSPSMTIKEQLPGTGDLVYSL